MEDDILKKEFRCLRCGGILKEKRPLNDKFLFKDINRTIRLFCPCGYYRDEIAPLEDFRNN